MLRQTKAGCCISPSRQPCEQTSGVPCLCWNNCQNLIFSESARIMAASIYSQANAWNFTAKDQKENKKGVGVGGGEICPNGYFCLIVWRQLGSQIPSLRAELIAISMRSNLEEKNSSLLKTEVSLGNVSFYLLLAHWKNKVFFSIFFLFCSWTQKKNVAKPQKNLSSGPKIIIILSFKIFLSGFWKSNKYFPSTTPTYNLQ